MDHYGAHGELLAAEHSQSCLGPFLVDSGTERAYEFNLDGTTTVWARGQGLWVEAEDKDRHNLTRDEYMSMHAEHFYNGEFHDWACWRSFFTGVETMRSKSCKWDLSPAWELWISWASAIMRDVAVDEQTR